MRTSALLLGVSILGVAPTGRADDDPEVVPAVRVAMGPSFRVEPDADTLASFALDATSGATVFGDEIWGITVNGELGYAFDSRSDNLHAFNLTAGVGYGGLLIGATLQPRLLVGKLGDQFAIGMRNGIVFRAMADIFTLEVAHRFLHHEGPLKHDAVLLFGVNPGGLLYLASEIADL